LVAAWFVSELAAPELGLGRPERAALLVGAADRALLRLGAVRTPGDRPEHDRVLEGLRCELGEHEFRRLLAEGGRLHLDAAVRLALADDDEALGRLRAEARSAA
jgi:hypothetical protein